MGWSLDKTKSVWTFTAGILAAGIFSACICGMASPGMAARAQEKSVPPE